MINFIEKNKDILLILIQFVGVLATFWASFTALYISKRTIKEKIKITPTYNISYSEQKITSNSNLVLNITNIGFSTTYITAWGLNAGKYHFSMHSIDNRVMYMKATLPYELKSKETTIFIHSGANITKQFESVKKRERVKVWIKTSSGKRIIKKLKYTKVKNT